jgi:MFS family permease
MITLGLISGGENLIVVDIAPDYSGSIYGFTNAFSSLPGFLAPLFAGLILDKANVRKIFLLFSNF